MFLPSTIVSTTRWYSMIFAPADLRCWNLSPRCAKTSTKSPQCWSQCSWRENYYIDMKSEQYKETSYSRSIPESYPAIHCASCTRSLCPALAGQKIAFDAGSWQLRKAWAASMISRKSWFSKFRGMPYCAWWKSNTFFGSCTKGACARRPLYAWSMVPVFSDWKESERVIPSLRVAGNFENLKVGVVLSIDCCSWMALINGSWLMCYKLSWNANNPSTSHYQF